MNWSQLFNQAEGRHLLLQSYITLKKYPQIFSICKILYLCTQAHHTATNGCHSFSWPAVGCVYRPAGRFPPSAYLRVCTESVDGVFTASVTRPTAAPVEVHLHGGEEPRQPLQSHPVRQLNNRWRRDERTDHSECDHARSVERSCVCPVLGWLGSRETGGVRPLGHQAARHTHLCARCWRG